LSNMTIVLNVGTGNIGGALAKKLLDAGAHITVINRSVDKVADLAARGARIVVGSMDDPKTLESAFAGCKSLFWLTPPIHRPDQNEWSLDNIKKAVVAAKAAGINNVVMISSFGAQARAGGVIAWCLDGENLFKQSLPNVAILRPGFFFENVLRDAASVANAGSVFTPSSASAVAVSWVATADVANRAASFLLTDTWKGQLTVGVHGPADYTFDQAFAVISKAIGKQVNVVHVSIDQFQSSLKGYGVPDFMITGFAAMYDDCNTGRVFTAEPRTVDTFTPTTLYEWAVQQFKPAVESASHK